MSDLHRRIRLALSLYLLGLTLGFFIPFCIGAMAGMATPGGWAAWQIGALIACIVGGIAAIVMTVAFIMYVLDA